jgi:hypothetical protein
MHVVFQPSLGIGYPTAQLTITHLLASSHIDGAS